MFSSTTASLRIGITPGEPAGIGPDLVVKLAQQPSQAERVVIADPELIQKRANQLGLPISLTPCDLSTPPKPQQAGELSILAVPLEVPSVAGQLDPGNAKYVLQTLTMAGEGCLKGDLQAIVTGPVHKEIINAAGIKFAGHTEFFAALTKTPHVVMMLVAKDLRVALVTTHLPLAEVSKAITPQWLQETIQILHRDLQIKFNIKKPRILVAGLNPHAGEGGYLGREEIEVITPVLEQCRNMGMDLMGPLPADTLFLPKYLQNTDAVLAMYHDQGLPVLKHYGFGEAVNVTLGLPFVRTSVDHGTALDLAGTGNVDVGSMQAAFALAVALAV